MNLTEKINVLVALGEKIINEDDEKLNAAKRLSQMHNPWFTQDNIKFALTNISNYFLNRNLLEDFASKYHLENVVSKKRVGLILAGNIPLVGFHDILCVFLTDNISLLKFSSKDKYLLEFILQELKQIDERTSGYFEVIERLVEYDAVIATGSDNASRYFEKYFSEYPHIIRKNRGAVAIVQKEASDEEIKKLGKDVFTFYGLGCRNVSKMYLERGFEIERIMKIWAEEYPGLLEHNKYKNNYDYSYALHLLNKANFFANDVVILHESSSVFSRIACVGFEYYDSEIALAKALKEQRDDIQCVLTQKTIETFKRIPFGESQKPSLVDYADGIDSIQFLLTI